MLVHESCILAIDRPDAGGEAIFASRTDFFENREAFFLTRRLFFLAREPFFPGFESLLLTRPLLSLRLRRYLQHQQEFFPCPRIPFSYRLALFSSGATLFSSRVTLFFSRVTLISSKVTLISSKVTLFSSRLTIFFLAVRLLLLRPSFPARHPKVNGPAPGFGALSVNVRGGRSNFCRWPALFRNRAPCRVALRPERRDRPRPVRTGSGLSILMREFQQAPQSQR